jgi:hypothetical protein
MNQKEEPQLCKNCVNLIEDRNKSLCDYGHFSYVDIQQSLLYTAEMMDCNDYYELKDV